MSAGGLVCSKCGVKLKTAKPLPPGTNIRCPKCGGMVTVPSATERVQDVDVVEFDPKEADTEEPGSPTDAPRRKKGFKKRKKSSRAPIVIAAVMGTSVFVGLCVLGVILFLNRGSKPSEGLGSDDPAQERVLRGLYDQYVQCIGTSNAQGALSLVDRRSLEWWNEVLESARSADRRRLSSESMARQLLIVLLRAEYRRAALARLTGREAFLKAIERSWVNHAGIGKEELGSIKFLNDKQALAFRPANVEYAIFFFVKEEGSWRLELWRSGEDNAPIQHRMERQVRDLQITEETFILSLAASILSRRPDPKLLDGPMD